VKEAIQGQSVYKKPFWTGGLPVLLAAPQIILLLTLLVFPLGVLVWRSLHDSEVGLSFTSYLTIVQSRRYLEAFMNTALIAVASTVLAIALCTPAAIYIERGRGWGRKLLAILLTIPLSLPGIVIGFFIILNFGLTGVVPQALEKMTGDRHLQIAYTFWGMLLGYLYFQIPRVILVVRGAVAGLSQDVIDVAQTLGTPTWRLYAEIILPTLRPALLNAASLCLATAFGAFGTAATLSRGYRVVPLEIASAFTESFQPQLAASMSLLLALITTALLVGVSHLLGGQSLTYTQQRK
jgi:putative spermidine/putrescine transport system permease protein